MQLKKLVIHNFAQHRHKEIEFPSSGVCVLQGHNGTGKSNLINAVRFVIEGSVPGSLSKEDFLTWGEQEGYVELTFEALGIEGKLERALHKSSSKLKWGKFSSTSTKDIAAKLEELLGISFKLADNFVFIKQGHLNALVDSTPAERLKLLHKLFGTDIYEVIYNKLNDELSRAQSYVVPAQTSSSIYEQLVVLEEQQCDLISSIAANSKIYNSFNVTSAMELWNKNKYIQANYNDRNSGFEKTRGILETAQFNLTDSSVQLSELIPKLAALETTISGLAVLISDVKTRVNLRDQARSLINQRAQTLASMDEATAQRLNLQPPTLPIIKIGDPTEFKDLINELTRQYNNAGSFIQRYKSSYTTAAPQCSSCGTTVIVTSDGTHINLSTKLVEYEADLEKLSPQLKQAKDLYKAYSDEQSNYAAAMTAYKNQCSNLDAKITYLNQQLATYSAVAIPEVTEDLDQLNAKYLSAMSDRTRISSLITKLQHDQSSLTELIDRSKVTLLKLSVDYELIKGYDFEAVKIQIDDHTRLGASISFSQGQLTQLDRAIMDKRTLLDKTIAVEAELKAKQAYSSVLSRAKEIFHRDRFPAQLVKVYFNQVNNTWNEMLSLLDVPFAAYLSDDLSIKLEFANSTALVDQASGGQKSCVSLAFVLAISKLFTSNTGFVVLDEPTYGLDSDHIDRVTDILQVMDSYAKSNNTLILLVTHEEIIKSRFDQTIVI